MSFQLVIPFVRGPIEGDCHQAVSDGRKPGCSYVEAGASDIQHKEIPHPCHRYLMQGPSYGHSMGIKPPGLVSLIGLGQSDDPC